jgi:NADPH:quinone reductase
MRAATIRDGEVVVAEHPDPQPGTGEVLVRVTSAGLNGADLLQVKGGYPAPLGSPPDIPGLEFAGEVVATGTDAARFAVGDRVMGIAGGGGQAELCKVHERQLMPVPDGVDLVVAGGIPEVFTTAHDAIFTQAQLHAGERLLVSGAAGGVGTAAVQLGRTTGAHVTASVRDEGAWDAVRELGAHEVIAPDATADSGPFDVVLELVGAPYLDADLKALATNGRIVVIGVGAGVKTELNLMAIMGKRAVLRGSTLRARPLEEKALTARALERQVLGLFARGELHVPVAESFALDDAAAAYARFSAGKKVGKVLLVP